MSACDPKRTFVPFTHTEENEAKQLPRMKFADWKGIAEHVGIVAIVASLLFVGLQLKQSHEIALATQYQSRAEATMNLHLASIEADSNRLTAIQYFRFVRRSLRLPFFLRSIIQVARCQK